MVISLVVGFVFLWVRRINKRKRKKLENELKNKKSGKFIKLFNMLNFCGVLGLSIFQKVCQVECV